MRRERLAFAQDGLDSLDVFLMDMTTWLSILWTSLDMGMNIQLFTGYFGVQGTRVLKNTILQHVNVHHQFYMFIYNYIYIDISRWYIMIYRFISFYIGFMLDGGVTHGPTEVCRSGGSFVPVDAEGTPCWTAWWRWKSRSMENYWDLNFRATFRPWDGNFEATIYGCKYRQYNIYNTYNADVGATSCCWSNAGLSLPLYLLCQLICPAVDLV